MLSLKAAGATVPEAVLPAGRGRIPVRALRVLRLSGRSRPGVQGSENSGNAKQNPPYQDIDDRIERDGSRVRLRCGRIFVVDRGHVLLIADCLR